MKKPIFYFILIVLLFFLAACSSVSAESAVEVETAVTQSTSGSGMGMGNGMGMGSSMMARHHATIPEEYAGMTNPIQADTASIERGAEIYATHCASCHGDGGMGDGPAAASLNPAPAAIAHTSQMLGDDYLYWRISEGGAQEPFNSGMVAWKGIIDENTRWDVINYIQALGSGQAMPRQGMGGAAFDPATAAEMQADMLAEAVAQGAITEEEAAIFADAHDLVDGNMMQNRGAGMNGNMDNMMTDTLAEMVAAGELTQAQADTFASVHDRLVAAGLMQ